MNMKHVKMEADPEKVAGAPEAPVEEHSQDEGTSDFSDLFTDNEDAHFDMDVPEDSGPPETSAEPERSEPAPSEALPDAGPPPPAPAAPAAEPETPPPAPTAAQPEPPAAQPYTPPQEEPVDMAALRSQAQQQLEQRYSLSKEDAEALISEPETVLPRLMSNIYLDVYDNIMRSMQVFLPQMVQQVNMSTSSQQRDESDFYSAWPRLADRKNEVSQIGQMYRRMNPTATKEQFIRDVGLHASIALQLPVESPLVQTPQTAPSATPETPPYVPPRGGPSIPPPRRAPGQVNQFEELDREWNETEREEYGG